MPVLPPRTEEEQTLAWIETVRAAIDGGARPMTDDFLKLSDQYHRLLHKFEKIARISDQMHVQLRALQQKVEERNVELALARDRAEQASRAKSQFLALMSHELRTPLNAIIGFSDMQRAEVFGPLGDHRYLEYANDIHASGQHLLNLINNILDISKAEAGKLAIVAGPVDLGPLVDDIVRLMRSDAERKPVTLTLSIAEPMPPCQADPQALRQILLNLLSNAVKFTPAGGSVTLCIHEEDGGITFRVIDTGIGIDPAKIPRLLEPFEQAEPGLTRTNGGTGLGLPLVNTFARLHGGTLRIDSEEGKGASATVWLPGPVNPYS